MAINITGLDEDVFFAVNTAVSVSLFATLVVPPLALCVLCVLALILAEGINKKVKILLINIFSVEIGIWIRWTSSFLGYPLRFRALAGKNWPCSLDISLGIVNGLMKFPANALYSVLIYVFTKHGEKKLKWSIMVPCIALSWIIVTLTFGIIPYLSEVGATNSYGFCSSNPSSIIFRSVIPFYTVISLICLIIVIVSSILTVIYVKGNTLEGSADIKKAVTKVLIYLAITTTLSFVTGLLPAATSAIKEAVGTNIDAIGETIVDYVLRIIFLVNSIPTPVIALIILKATRNAFKDVKTKLTNLCCRKRPDVVQSIELAPKS